MSNLPHHLINARLPGSDRLHQITVANGLIAAISPLSTPTSTVSMPSHPVLDLEGDWVSLAGVDLQINGALGLAFPDLDWPQLDQLSVIADLLWQQGVAGFLPTLVTTTVANIQRSLAVIDHFMALQNQQVGITQARVLGVHLEGPFLNPAKRGAHPAQYLLPLTLEQAKQVLGEYAHLVRVITLAPELDPNQTVIPYLVALGITVSLGHSLATASQAQAAFQQGASMVTHGFNAMPPLHHREPGLLAAALTTPGVYCGLIADGQHVDPMMVEILLRASQYDQGVFLVSDALSPLGLGNGTYPWDTRHIIVNQGTARLPDGTLAGTTLPLVTGVKNLAQWGVCPVEGAIALATSAPRRAIGLPDRLIGQPAQLLRWRQTDKNLTWHRLSFR